MQTTLSRGTHSAAALLLPALLVLCCARADPDSPPSGGRNVLLLSIDCLNQRQFAGALESGHVRNLARLVEQSRVFERAYSHAPWTTPSHMSMLTGLYPSQHGRDVPWGLMIKYNQYFDRVSEAPMLSELLSEAGFETAAFVGGATTSRRFGFARGFSTFRENPKEEGQTDLPKNVASFERWLDERQEGPFFAFLHTFDLHRPWPVELETEEEVFTYIDDHVGRVVGALERKGLYESTLIVLTGDHGSKMIRVAKKCCVHGAGHYEENLKVPLLLKLPGEGSTGTSQRLVRHIDILPTVLDVLGITFAAYRGDGRSMLDIDSGEARVELSFSEADARCARRFGLVTDTHKYIYTPQGHEQALLRGYPRFFDRPCQIGCKKVPPVEQLFDLRNDPYEEKSLLDGERDAELEAKLTWFRERMGRYLNLERAYRVRVADGVDTAALDPEINEALRTLGYLN
jgi:arylsulfatase A-like enzyme